MRPLSGLARADENFMCIETSWHAKGRAEGRIEGRIEARVITLAVLEDRFGSLPKRAIRAISANESFDELLALVKKAQYAASLRELGINFHQAAPCNKTAVTCALTGVDSQCVAQ